MKTAMKMVKMKLLFFSFFSILFTFHSNAQVHPSIEWKTLTTANYQIIYDARQNDLAMHYSLRLEEGYKRLRSNFKQFPEKPIIVLSDSTDQTNGFATGIPYPYIFIFPVLPAPMETISDYGDWVLELLMHENVHLITFEYSRDFMSLLRRIFGNIITPNMLLPRWWTEGIAVDQESRLSQFGRMRSPYQDAYLRSLVSSKRIDDFSFSEINESLVPTHPYGARPYLFGSLMWSQMIADHGTKVIDELFYRYGGRIPYFIEAPALEIMGSTYENIFHKTIYDLNHRSKKQIEQIKSNTSLTQTIPLELEGLEQTNPSISSDQKKFLYISRDENGKKSVKILIRSDITKPFSLAENKALSTETSDAPTDTFKIKDGPPSGAISRASWFNDSNQVVFDKVDSINRFEKFSDLYVYNLTTQKTEALTKGIRGREPSVSPNDTQIVFIKLGANLTTLSVIDLNSKLSSDIYTAPHGIRLSSPSFINNAEVLVSARDTHGIESFLKINILTKTTEIVLENEKNVSLPRICSIGTIYSSNKTGVPNLYLSDLNFKNTKPISNTDSAFYSTDFDPSTQDIYVTYVSESGFKIGRLPKEIWQQEIKINHIEPLYHDRYPTPTQISVEPTKPDFSISDYKALDYLLPNYWIPYVSTVDGGYYAQIMTGGQDPLAKHIYSVFAAYNSAVERGSYSLSYTNNNYQPLININASEYVSYLLLTQDIYSEQNISFISSWENEYKNTEFNTGVGWVYKKRDLFSNSKRSGPIFNFSYTSISKGVSEISPEKGATAFASVIQYSSESSDVSYNQFNFSGSKYYSNKLPKHHVALGTLNLQYIDQTIPFSYLSTSTNAKNPLNPFMIRGYSEGSLLGKNFFNTNLEYRFPVKEIYKGIGHIPFFIRRLHGALVSDLISVDGYKYEVEKNDDGSITRYYRSKTIKDIFATAGFEFNLDLTVGYHIPMTWTFGYYFGDKTFSYQTGMGANF